MEIVAETGEIQKPDNSQPSDSELAVVDGSAPDGPDIPKRLAERLQRVRRDSPSPPCAMA